MFGKDSILIIKEKVYVCERKREWDQGHLLQRPHSPLLHPLSLGSKLVDVATLGRADEGPGISQQWRS